MNRSILIILVGLMSMLINSNAYSEPQDVKGWGKTHWSMTVDEILEVLKGEVEQEQVNTSEGELITVIKNEIDITGNKYKVALMMDDKETLERVDINPIIKKYHSVPNFYALEKLLTAKYGKPSISNETRGTSIVLSRIWNFPSSVIELAFLELKMMKDSQVLNISYLPNQAKSLDNL